MGSLYFAEFLEKYMLILQAAYIVASISCANKEFQCDNGRCIELEKLCDFTDDCGDNSDEIRHVTGFKCPMGRQGNECILPQRHVTDATPQCNNKADLCHYEANTCYVCLTLNVTLADSQLCDGVIDCPDATDECLCEVTRAAALCDRLQPGQRISCDKNTTSLKLSRICDGVIDCGDHIDELYCRHSQRRPSLKCFDNFNFEKYELVTSCYHHFLKYPESNNSCKDFKEFCDSEWDDATRQSSYTCGLSSTNVSMNFSSSAVCDGSWYNCSEAILSEVQICPDRFYCLQGNDTLINIDISRVCDGIFDCKGGSDEVNCTNRFKCEKGVPSYVPQSYVLDGKEDCSDGSDECPAFLNLKLYSSRHHLIESIEIRIWLWIMAVVGLVGNIVVFSFTFRELIRGKFKTPVSRANHILVLNLNVADALTSVYLVFIGVKIIEYSGKYCQVDISWRTSFSCTFIGSLSILSAEASLLTLTVMTTQRLYSVLDPIKSRIIVFKWIGVSILFVWCFSALVAAIPAMLPGLFVEGYWIPSKYFNTELVNHQMFEKFLQNLLFLTEPLNETISLSDFDAQKYLQERHSHLQILGYFGYYSENSVCMPDFYEPLSDMGWYYTTIVVSINLLAFLYVAIAYWVIYRRSFKNALQSTQTNKNATRMQKRIAKLVAVNFAAWVPICIGTYAQLAFSEQFPDSVYVVTAVFFFPINSVVNPLLYSDVFENLWLKLKTVLTRSQ